MCIKNAHLCAKLVVVHYLPFFFYVSNKALCPDKVLGPEKFHHNIKDMDNGFMAHEESIPKHLAPFFIDHVLRSSEF